MHSSRLRIATAIFIGLSSFLFAQKLSKEQRDILELQDSRSLGNGRLVSYLQSTDRNLRYRAAIALGNLQDTSTVSSLVPLLQDADVLVRAAAAFALGQIGSIPAEKALIGALTPDQDIQVLPSVFEALGKCGDAEALKSVIAYIPSARNIAVKSDQALSIARFALRKITSERGVWLCFDLLKDNHSITRSSALYALWRCAPLGVIDVEISNRAYLLVNLMSDKNTEVRINLAALLGKTKSDEAPRLIKMFQEVEGRSPDWRVQVQLARSIGSVAGSDPSLLGILLSDLESQNDHLKITSLMTLANVDSNAVVASGYGARLLSGIKQLAEAPSRSAILVQGEAIVTLGRLFPWEFDEVRSIFDSKRLNNLVRAKYIEALSYQPTSENLRYVIRRLTDDSVRVAMAAWDFLKRMVQPGVLESMYADGAFVDSLPAIFVDRAEQGLKRNDLAITTLIADVFADSSVVDKCKRAGLYTRIVNDLKSAYLKLSSGQEAETMLAVQTTFAVLRDTTVVPALEQTLTDPNRTVALGAAAALRKITGRDFQSKVSETVIPLPTENDWRTLESISPGQRISFKTTKGTFTIRLRKQDAPFTVLAFFKLVRQKFYNGLTFHRVVPDFVIQGGDPRGDGWGGPGFTLRSEFSMATFGRGSVGMASSGKDTEGCQFFVTHVPTPHLDGRYTLFATVTSGMDVVDRIQVGDRILSATIE